MGLSATALMDAKYHFHPYTQPRDLEKNGALVIVSGRGVHVTDENGKEYIEGMAGLWCAALGFSEQRLVDAAHRQLQQLPYYHTFSGKVSEPVAALVERLMAMAPVPMARILFANSGSESNDTAVKLVRYYHNAIGRPQKKKIIARGKAYHGVTLAAASLSGIPTMHTHFDLPMPDTVRVGCPHPYQFAQEGESQDAFAERLARELEETILREGPETVGAFIAEPVQGAGGVIIPPPRYFDLIQPILKRHEILLIADEVVSGFGRLGKPFGSEVFGLQPDFITVAKMLTSAYVPMSALYINDRVYQAIADASAGVGIFGHGYTYGGHPVACAVALEALKIYEEQDIVGHVNRVSPRLQDGLRKFSAHPHIGDVRGMGLIAAVELAMDPVKRTPFPPERGVGAYLVRRAQEHGLILRAMAGDIVAFSPPLIITDAEIDEMLRRFEQALQDTTAWIRSW